jgi:hypothetical protein
VALPLFDEEIFQKIPIVKPGGRIGDAGNVDTATAAKRPKGTVESISRGVTGQAGEVTAQPAPVAVGSGGTVRPGTAAARSSTASARPGAAVQPGTVARPGEEAPSFSPRLVHVETARVQQKVSKTKTTTTSSPAKQLQEPAEVYDYYAANQIRFLDDDVTEPLEEGEEEELVGQCCHM